MTRAAALAGSALVLLAAAPAAAQDRAATAITPYVGIDQTVFTDFDDTVTYTTAIAGVDATVQTRRVQVDASVEYQHQFSWQKYDSDLDSVTGLVRGVVQVAPVLSFEAGALATRTRVDNRGAAPGFYDTARDNVGQLYSIYLGPTLATDFGPVALNAAYRYGYTKLDGPDDISLANGLAPRDVFDSAQTQVATASAGVAPGRIAPFGLTTSAGWQRNDARQLDQRFDDRYVRGDVLQPVSRVLAVTAGIGYERLSVSERPPLLDGAGRPVIDDDGRYVTNKAAPRRIAYDFDGIYWDAGVVWKPNPRTVVEGHVGRRYDSWLFTGSAQYAASRSVGIGISVYDTQSTFAQQLQDGISSLPTSFLRQRGGFDRRFSGCVFGTTSRSTGGCMNDVFQSIATASYRMRGVEGMVTINRGPLNFGGGVGYSNRRFHAANGAYFNAYGLEDDSYFAQLFANYQLDPNSGLSGSVFADWYDSYVPGYLAIDDGVFSTGATAEYYRNFGRLQTAATLGIYNFDLAGFDDYTTAQGQLSARYSF